MCSSPPAAHSLLVPVSLPAVLPSRFERVLAAVGVWALDRAASSSASYQVLFEVRGASWYRPRRGRTLYSGLVEEVGLAGATVALSRPGRWGLALLFAYLLSYGAAAGLALGFFVEPSLFSLVLLAFPGVTIGARVTAELVAWCPPPVSHSFLERLGGTLPAALVDVSGIFSWVEERVGWEVAETMAVLAPDFDGDLSDLFAATTLLLEA